MINKMIRVFLLFYILKAVYRNRYRLLNWILKSETLRKWAVAATMRLPDVRELLIRSVFRPTNTP